MGYKFEKRDAAILNAMLVEMHRVFKEERERISQEIISKFDAEALAVVGRIAGAFQVRRGDVVLLARSKDGPTPDALIRRLENALGCTVLEIDPDDAVRVLRPVF